jgi:glutaredoxin-related protein
MPRLEIECDTARVMRVATRLRVEDKQTVTYLSVTIEVPAAGFTAQQIGELVKARGRRVHLRAVEPQLELAGFR